MHSPVKGKKLSKTSKGVGKKHRTKEHKDRSLPHQGYLRGFVGPSRAELQKPLWYLDVHRKQWAEIEAQAEIGLEQESYDSRGLATNVETADQVFAELERTFRLSVMKWWPISSQTGLIIWILYCGTYAR